MENLNIPPFLPGDKVVYITGKVMPKYSMHVISDVKRSDCGCWSIEINGDKCCNGGYNIWKCTYGCNKIFEGDAFYGYDPSSFRKVDEQPFRAVSFEKIMEETEKICVN